MKFKKKENRKSIKKLAFSDPKGVLVKALVFILFLCALIMYGFIYLGSALNINLNSYLYNSLINLITGILISPFILNYVKMLVMNSNDEIYDLKDLFSFSKKSFKFLAYFSLVTIIYFIINYMLSLFFVFGFVCSLILFIFLLPIFFVMPYVFLEDDYTFKEFIFKSFKIINKKRIEFYSLIISFSGWFILGIFTFGFLYLWIIPYLFISLTYLYLSFKGEKKFKKVYGLSNKMVIIVFTLIVLFSSMVTFISSPGSFKQMIGIYSGNKVSGTLSYGGIKVNYYVPYDYKINSSTSTSKTYLKNNTILQYSIYLSAVNEAIEMDKEIVNEYKNSSIYKSVSDEEFTVRANNKNIRCYKFNTVSLNGNESSTIIAYIPKDKFILTISLLSNKNLNKKEINSFVAMQ